MHASPQVRAANWLFVAPALIINLLIILVPGMLTVLLAFCTWDGVSMPVWAGLANFASLAGDGVFWHALRNNLIWTAIFLTIPMAMGLLAAVMLLIARRGQTVLQVIYFLPIVLATVISARIWQGMIYNPVSGVIGLLQHYGLPVTNPLGQPSTALFGVATVDLWHWWGFLAVVFYAALRQVDMSIVEAAVLDGASFWQLVRHILLPAIRPTIVLMMVMTVIWSFLAFDFVYVMTQGGPAYSSELLSTLAYRHAFYDLDIGQAAATALVISIFGLAATFVYVRIQARETA
jgi:raffinose/stachyose/melibiose transport system permease protein